MSKEKGPYCWQLFQLLHRTVFTLDAYQFSRKGMELLDSVNSFQRKIRSREGGGVEPYI